MNNIKTQKIKGQNGITIIILVVTIIVLLILAGVSISIVVGGDGIFDYTENTVQRWNSSSETENQTIQEIFNEMHN